MRRGEEVRWLRPQSAERRRRHLAGWLLVMGLGVLIGVGAPLISWLGSNVERNGGGVLQTSPARPSDGPPSNDQAPADRKAENSPPPAGSRASSVEAVSPSDQSNEVSGSAASATDAVAPTQSMLSPPPAPAPEAAGWWVILGSFAEASGPGEEGERVAAAAQRCQISFGTGRSSDFEGLTPGLLVYLSGPYEDRASAQQSLRRITPCISDAYVKWARHRAKPPGGDRLQPAAAAPQPSTR